MSHHFALRVYFEDTDLAGIVYYANYLKFIERARSEMVRARGIGQARLKAREGLVFVVRHLEADYLAPAHFDDELVVKTSIKTIGGARLVLQQDVFCGEKRLFSACVTLVMLSAAGRAARIPANIRQVLK